jgi:hypothetical protein
MTFIIGQIDCITLHTIFMLKDLFCMFLGLKIMLYQHGRLSSHNMRALSGNMELDYRTEKKKQFSISHPISQTAVNTKYVSWAVDTCRT